MLPLQPVALGLVIVALVVDGNGWDLLPDPIGWALVLLGTLALPREIHRRDAMVAAAGLALVASAAVWPPGVAERVAGTDESRSWALSLPQLAYLFLLADGLRRAARAADEGPRSAWFATAGALVVGAAVLPVLVFGAGADALAGIAVLCAMLALVLLVVLTLMSARASWAGGRPRAIPGT